MKSRRTQGLVCIGVGLVGAALGVVLLASASRLDSSELYKAPLWTLGSVILVVIGVLRLRGQS